MSDNLYPLTGSSKDVSVRQPKELICFSRDIHNKIHLDDSQLRYYYLPDSELNTSSGIDLQSGFSSFQQNPEEDVGQLAGLLSAVESYERSAKRKLPVDIITWRGLMRSLMMLPYENRSKIVLNVVVFDGQLFIQTDVASSRALGAIEKANQTDLNRRQQYSGYKFENIATLDKLWAKCSRKHIERRRKHKVNNIEQYITVVRTSVGKSRLLLGAEIDCSWDYKPDIHDLKEKADTNPLNHYVELKTTRVVDSAKTAHIFEKKLLKAWTQCFLVGIPQIVYGFRDDNLILRSVEQFKTDKIPILLRDSPFQPGANSGQKPVNACMKCLRFFSGLINWIKQTVPTDDETKTYRIEYDPSTNKNYVSVKENDLETTKKLLSDYDGANGGMLTNEFKLWRKELKEQK